MSKIPKPIINFLSENIASIETHKSIEELFISAGAPSNVPEGSKKDKTKEWFNNINDTSESPLNILGKIIECYIDIPTCELDDNELFGIKIDNPKKTFKNKIEEYLKHHNLNYGNGRVIDCSKTLSSNSLAHFISNKDIPSIESEFNRAISRVSLDPREAVSAASNILEAICKTYIDDKKLTKPNKQDLRNVWNVVKQDLGLDPSKLQDNDLKKILSGMISVVDGISSLRTHASSAHAEGRKRYNITPRHARLAIHSSHSIAMFILETWEHKDNL